MQVVFYFAGEITQVLDAIPWVRCASGNVFCEEMILATWQCQILSYIPSIWVLHSLLLSSFCVLYFTPLQITDIHIRTDSRWRCRNCGGQSSTFVLIDSNLINSSRDISLLQVHQVDDDTPAPSTRIITGNPALDGAVVGVGVGIIGWARHRLITGNPALWKRNYGAPDPNL